MPDQPPTCTEDCVLLTPEQAAQRLGISRWKLYDLLRHDALPSLRIGSCRRIPVRAIEDLVASLLRGDCGSAA